MTEPRDPMSAAPPPGGAARAADEPDRPQRITVPVTGAHASSPTDGVEDQAAPPVEGSAGAAPAATATSAGSRPEGADAAESLGEKAGVAAEEQSGESAAAGAKPVEEGAASQAGPETPVAEADEARQAAGSVEAPVSAAAEAAARQRDEYLALAQRTQADFDNYRKRMARELAAAESRGVRKLAVELLPALDNLGLALAAAEAALPADGESASVEAGSAAHPARLVEGIRLVHAELLAALKRAGIEAFSPEGEAFDPNEHEAMAQHPADGVEAGTITQVYQQGYRVAGTLIRPARVVVAG